MTESNLAAKIVKILLSKHKKACFYCRMVDFFAKIVNIK